MHTEYKNSQGKTVPSVTTVLKVLNKDNLIEWANYIGLKGYNYTSYMNVKALLGTYVHEYIEAELENRAASILGTQKMCNEAYEIAHRFKCTKDKLQMDNIITEKSLSCDTYGGTLDLIADIVLDNDTKVKILGDFKTSKAPYISHFIQLGGYLNLIKINDYKLYEQIKLCMIINVNKDKVLINWMYKEDCETYFTDIFLKLLEVYNSYEFIKVNFNQLIKSEKYI